MPTDMEDILGLGEIDTERKVPGVCETIGREFRYVSYDDSGDISVLFRKIVREIDPPIATNGGVINERCVVELPTGERYFALSYRGDLEGWRKQIESGAAALDLLVACVRQDRLILADGTEVLLSDCKLRFY